MTNIFSAFNISTAGNDEGIFTGIFCYYFNRTKL
jgi:hypothetical protein